MTPGIDINPGQTVTRTVFGYAADPTQAVIGFGGVVGIGDFSGAPAESHFQTTAKQLTTYGAYGGTVTANGKGLPGVQISLHADFVPHPYEAQTTDSQGHFLFSKILTGAYFIDFNPPKGWVVQTANCSQQVQVTIADATSHLDDRYVATPPPSDILQASISFDQPTYHMGEDTDLTAVLTNPGTATLSHVTSACTGSGTPDELHGNTPGWGALAFNAAGVTLAPGEKATYHVSEPVPAGALASGHVYANCYFGPNVGGPAVGYPLAIANARVVSATGGTSTTLPSSAPSTAESTSAAVGAGSTSSAMPTRTTTASASGSVKKLASTGVSVLGPAIAALVLLAAGLAAMRFARHRKTTS